MDFRDEKKKYDTGGSSWRSAFFRVLFGGEDRMMNDE